MQFTSDQAAVLGEIMRWRRDVRHFRADPVPEAVLTRLSLDAEFQKLGPATVAAFCAEPVVGTAMGCVTALPAYFKAVRGKCGRGLDESAFLCREAILSRAQTVKVGLDLHRGRHDRTW